MQTVLPWRFRYVNLRNHRKILVIDGRIGFTGGLNIRAANFLAEKPGYPTQDLHFYLQGPVVAELQRTFAEDWIFTTGEKLAEDTWFPPIEPMANGVARGISDGPDEDFDKLRTVILGALSAARSSVRVLTPYFLPDSEIMTGLRIASLRGVKVQIILPGISNLHMVKWASDAGLEELVAAGCKIFLTPPPFDHSKVMLVDNGWVLLGSANWDPRSLALNFEFNVECYDVHLAGTMGEILDAKAAKARELSLADLKSTNALLHLRNRFFRLFSPYL
jgi:cardiolipin synthase